MKNINLKKYANIKYSVYSNKEQIIRNKLCYIEL